ncbi:HEAT repeat domain-containing protein [uncultured Methanospirillum sp.]|uniref:HEAT repeat domain-containing protein n=1 Tax=uncultured Methanospirillum sp. TaxID=262503 RepID=UPI0029C90189|nr:HEAT repeat domain-containing protein [uncultured Methanospirillum sp.]
MMRLLNHYLFQNQQIIESGKLSIIILLSLVSLFASIFFLIFNHQTDFLFVYIFIPHLYLVPIILLALWFPKSGLRLVMIIGLLLGVFWLCAGLFGYPFPPLFIILYTGLDLAIFVVFLLYVKDRRLVETVISDLIIRSSEGIKDKKDVNESWQRDFDDIVSRLSHTDEEIREEAIGALSGISDERAVLPLIAALHDPSIMVRRAAADALGKTGSSKAVIPLIKALCDTDRIVREESAEALGHLGEVSNHELQIAGRNVDWRVRVGVLIALRITASSNSSPDLIMDLAGDQNVYVRREAIKTLGRIGEHKVLPYLVQALKDHDAGVRIRAIRAIARIGTSEEQRELIQICLNDSDVSVRMRAEEELKKVSHEPSARR